MTDDELLQSFCTGPLPAAEWTHEAHLRVAYLYVREFSLEEAHLLFRIHLIRLNTFHQVPESKDRGYHDTLTRMWLTLVAGARAADGEPVGAPGPTDSVAFLSRPPAFQDRKIGLRFYRSEERRVGK